ncbi:MAG: hypothetical protein HKN77_05200 [Woeseiaceae bacterium]|nr:hypothetical protein [Woeseiaceae bacterium]
MTNTSGAAMDARRSILIVHGRDMKPSADALMQISSGALRAGLERDFPHCAAIFDSVFKQLAYYGDLSNDLLHSMGRHYDEQLDLSDRREALASLRAINARKRFGIRQYDRLPGKSAVAEFLTSMLAPMFGMLGLWGWICGRKAPDVASYLKGESNYAADVRGRVRASIVERLAAGDEVMLISHGSGSAVAWDALWELSHVDEHRKQIGAAKISLWLTLGAPLGDRHCRKKLFGARETGLRRFPTNVVSWHNVAAEDDYTCYDNTVADDFKKMLNERAISAVHDYLIYNHAVRYGKSNPHSSVGYYIHPRVSKILADWLQPDEALRNSADNSE